MTPEEFIEYAMQRNVYFSIHATNGMFDLRSGKEVLDYLENPDAVCAKKHRVSEETYRLWKSVHNGEITSPVCSGKNKKGQSCKKEVWERFDIGDIDEFNPKDFDPNQKFCKYHRKKI
jgi:hypothetical protein